MNLNLRLSAYEPSELFCYPRVINI